MSPRNRVLNRFLNRRWMKSGLGLMIGTAATCGAIAYVLDRSAVEAAQLVAHAPTYPWGFSGALASLDHASVRRGWQVYRTVCAACHSVRFVAFGDLVDVCYNENEVKAIAAEYDIQDGPDENGEYFERPGKLQDRVPMPYPNEEAARAANNGANPVDLTYVLSARHNGVNYVYGLLTGYMDPPAGVELRDGQAFNPYFEGGAIGMAEVLQDGMVEYDDGTPAHKSQMAKDVVEFLVWTSNQDWDSRKVVCLKAIGISLILCAVIYPVLRSRGILHKHTKICYLPRNRRSDDF